MAYAVTPIGPAASRVVSLNNAGQLAYGVELDFPTVTLVYQNGAIAKLQGPGFTFPAEIADNGLVVGTSRIPAGAHGGSIGFLWNVASGLVQTFAPGSETQANAVNIKGQVIGSYPQPSPHFDAAIAVGKSPALDTASANFSMSGMSRCSGMFGISS